MQRVLEKMAKKLNAYDEASLMQLWQQYASQVREFEPTRRWEEAALALCLIQAVHLKNQLFNYNLALSNSPADKEELPPLPDFFFLREQETAKGKKKTEKRPRATVLHFPDRQGEQRGDSPLATQESAPENDNH